MVYQTRWEPLRAKQCQKEAEERATRSRPAPYGFLYRFEDHTYASSDEYGDYSCSAFYVELEAIPIRKVTLCGWTIDANNSVGWRFIAKGKGKRYALPTIEEALESFIKRKERQSAIYRARADRADRAITLAKGRIFDDFSGVLRSGISQN